MRPGGPRPPRPTGGRGSPRSCRSAGRPGHRPANRWGPRGRRTRRAKEGGRPVSDLPSEISLREVGPRDGLQNEDPVPTQAKIELIDRLSETGVRRIEAVSFVKPEAIPQMADADEVWRGI